MRGLGWTDCVDGEEIALAHLTLVAGAEIFPSKVCCVPLRGLTSNAGPWETNFQLVGGNTQAIVP